MFEVKFGTPKPVTFREYCEYGNQVMDIDLDVRFVGKCEVSEYDNARYANYEEVSSFIKSHCCEILQKCLDNWPEGKSVMRSRFSGLDESFSSELKNSGISAKTEIILKNLTEDSQTLYDEALKVVTTVQTDFGWDHVNFDTNVSRPEGTYMVSPAFLGFKYKDGRVFYKPGDRVEVDYFGVASDTSYHVTVNAPELRVEYGSVIHIAFTMPDHDVYISIGAQSVMTCMPGNMGITGMMGMGMNADKPVASDGSEWTCPLCGAGNKGKFCSECGGARP